MMAETPAQVPAALHQVPFRGPPGITPRAPNAPRDEPIDLESKRGRFGWDTLELNHFPYLFRRDREKFISVRIFERKLINRFLDVLPPETNTCHRVPSFFVTESEWRLLNHVNMEHCDCHFGKDPFSVKDLLVSLNDAIEIYHFLDFCFKKLQLKRSESGDRCGFVCYNGESFIPFVIIDGTKLLPVFYFEGETEELEPLSKTVEGWDLVTLYPLIVMSVMITQGLL